jgi:hypothetical protein
MGPSKALASQDLCLFLFEHDASNLFWIDSLFSLILVFELATEPSICRGAESQRGSLSYCGYVGVASTNFTLSFPGTLEAWKQSVSRQELILSHFIVLQNLSILA